MSVTASAVRAGRAFVELFADDAKLQATLKRAQVALASFSDFVRSVGLRMAAMGGILTLPFAKSVESAAKFEQAMANVRSVTKLAEDDFKKLGITARSLGQSTVFTSTQVADAMKIIGQSGFKAREEIEQLIGPVLDLASASGTDLAESTRITLGILKSQNMVFGDMRKSVDVLVESFTSANIKDIRVLGDAFKYIGPIVEAQKQPFTAVAAALQALHDAGIQGEMAGTNLRGALAALESPSEQARKVLGALGLTAAKLTKDGHMRQLPELVAAFEASLKGLNSAQQADLLGRIFDTQQLQGFRRLLQVGSVELSKMQKHLDEATGRAEELRKVRFDTLLGQFEILMGAIDELKISLGTHLIPDLKRAVQWITKAFDVSSEWIDANRESVIELGKGALAVAATGTALMGLGTAGGVAAMTIRGISHALRLAVSPARLLSSALGTTLKLLQGGERLGVKFAQTLAMPVLSFGRGAARVGGSGKVRKSDVGKLLEDVVSKRSNTTLLDRAPLLGLMYPAKRKGPSLVNRLLSPGRMGADLASTVITGVKAPVRFAVGAGRGLRGLGRLATAGLWAGTGVHPGMARAGRGDLRSAFQTVSAGAGLAIRSLGGLMRLPLAAVGVGLASLLNPMTLLAGGALLLVANWKRIRSTISGVASETPGMLSRAWSRIKADVGPTFDGIKSSAISAFRGISSAIEAGDIPAAMRILWQGLQGIWNQGVAYLKLKWIDLRTAGVDAFYGIQQTATTALEGLANFADLALFDWFGIRLSDVTAGFKAAWDWIKQTTGATVAWIQATWDGFFKNTNGNSVGFGDTLFHLFESFRKTASRSILWVANLLPTALIKPIEQVLEAIERIPGGKLMTVQARVALNAMNLGKFDVQEAYDNLEKQFQARGDKRTELKRRIAAGEDPDAKARREAAEKRLAELEEQRRANAEKGWNDRAEAQVALENQIELEKENLAWMIRQSEELRKQKAAKEALKDDAKPEINGGFTNANQVPETMPAGLRPGQQRAWVIQQQVKARKAMLEAKQNAAQQKKDAANEAKEARRHKNWVQGAGGFLKPGEDLHFGDPNAGMKEKPLFFGEDDDQVPALDMGQVQADLKARAPDLGGLRREAAGIAGRGGMTVNVDQERVVSAVDGLGVKLDEMTMAIDRLGTFGV